MGRSGSSPRKTDEGSCAGSGASVPTSLLYFIEEKSGRGRPPQNFSNKILTFFTGNIYISISKNNNKELCHFEPFDWAQDRLREKSEELGLS